jgi:two-component system OmpR family sensor kinase
VNRFRSVGAQLFFALVAVLAVALLATYFLVVPSLESQLESSKLDQLQRSLPPTVSGLPRDSLFWQLYADNQAAATNSRVVIFQAFGPPLELLVVADSKRVRSSAIASDKIARAAASEGRTVRGIVARGGSERAEVAAPVTGTSNVVLLSASLHDVESSVARVRRQLLLAVIPALLVAFAIASLVTRRLSRRIRRLEHAADQIAGGSFSEPVIDRGSDELARLAHSFESMRIRLQSLEEVRREFIANASHELRTPVFALAGSLELIAGDELDDRARREFVQTMREQVERLSKLTTELLDLSRLDAGRLELDLQTLPLEALAAALVEEFEAAAVLSEHPLTLTVESAPEVLADEHRTLQLGRILLDNALSHTPAGVAVRVRVGENDRYGFLAVEDEGPGIPPEQQERVFERFFRLDDERASGSGLGLAIARELATRMSGELTVRSKPGETTFVLSLPRQREDGRMETE